MAEPCRRHGLVERARDELRPQPSYRVPVVPLADGRGNGITTIDVFPADQSHRQDVAQPAEGVVPDVRVVSNRECIRQVSQATRIDNEMGLDRNPVDLRVFAENGRELRCSRTTRTRYEDR
jgi:hypothetical protein